MLTSPAVTTTESLAQAASIGDLEALAALYERYADKLVRYLALRTNQNLSVAEDIAAATWERVARTIATYEGRGNGFEPWLFTIARNKLKDHFTSASRRREVLTGEMLVVDGPDTRNESPAAALERKFTAERLVAEVRGLNSAQRQCVHLRFVVQLDLAETARVMGKNVNTVKQLQRRALRTLARHLGSDIDALTAPIPSTTLHMESPTGTVTPALEGGVR